MIVRFFILNGFQLQLQPSIGQSKDPFNVVQQRTINTSGDSVDLQRSTTGLKTKLLNALGFQSQS